MPLPAPPPVAALRSIGSNALLIGAARIDRSGRVHERALLHALGWGPGHRLELDSVDGLIVVASALAGRHIIDGRGGLPLPAAARRMCGIEPGPPLILAATVAEQVLIIHPAATVARLLAAYYTDLLSQASESSSSGSPPHDGPAGRGLRGGRDVR
jgi:bifunctional DNA-binding transcriptional regulator/antitoxin component of YhaV-PrlF toxin-antitoxin module